MREGAWALARVSVPRYRIAPVALAKLVDSQWDDTRAFAIAFIRDEVGGDKLGADAIITICDSIRPEVQDLGKALLLAAIPRSRRRQVSRAARRASVDESAVARLGPARSLRVRRSTSCAPLVPYFATVLSQVNRGRVAKERVIALLRREAAQAAPSTPRVLAPLLDRQSATIAITQKHPIIATMVDVHHLYPDVPLPISVVPPKGAAVMLFEHRYAGVTGVRQDADETGDGVRARHAARADVFLAAASRSRSSSARRSARCTTS